MEVALVAIFLEHKHFHKKLFQGNSGFPLKFSQVAKTVEMAIKPFVPVAAVVVLAGEVPEN